VLCICAVALIIPLTQSNKLWCYYKQEGIPSILISARHRAVSNPGVYPTLPMGLLNIFAYTVNSIQASVGRANVAAAARLPIEHAPILNMLLRSLSCWQSRGEKHTNRICRGPFGAHAKTCKQEVAYMIKTRTYLSTAPHETTGCWQPGCHV
jgi:hypothetical protein